MQGAKRKMEYSDAPNISLNEAALLGGFSRDKWRQLWQEVYKHIVFYWDTSNGVRVDLDSLIRAVFPHIAKKDTTRELVKQAFLSRLYEHRASRHALPGAKATTAE